MDTVCIQMTGQQWSDVAARLFERHEPMSPGVAAADSITRRIERQHPKPDEKYGWRFPSPESWAITSVARELNITYAVWS